MPKNYINLIPLILERSKSFVTNRNGKVELIGIEKSNATKRHYVRLKLSPEDAEKLALALIWHASLAKSY